MTIKNEGQYKLTYSLRMDPTGIGETPEVPGGEGGGGIAPWSTNKGVYSLTEAERDSLIKASCRGIEPHTVFEGFPLRRARGLRLQQHTVLSDTRSDEPEDIHDRLARQRQQLHRGYALRRSSRRIQPVKALLLRNDRHTRECRLRGPGYPGRRRSGRHRDRTGHAQG